MGARAAHTQRRHGRTHTLPAKAHPHPFFFSQTPLYTVYSPQCPLLRVLYLVFHRSVLQTTMLDASSESHFAGRCQECEV